MRLIEILPIIIAFLIIIFIIISIIKLVIINYKDISKNRAVSEYVTSSRLFDNSLRNRFVKNAVFFEGGQTSFKEPKSKSLARYDLIRSNSILKRN